MRRRRRHDGRAGDARALLITEERNRVLPSMVLKNVGRGALLEDQVVLRIVHEVVPPRLDQLVQCLPACVGLTAIVILGAVEGALHTERHGKGCARGGGRRQRFGTHAHAPRRPVLRCGGHVYVDNSWARQMEHR